MSVFAFFSYDPIAATRLIVFHKGRQACLWSPTLISNRLRTQGTLNTYSGLQPNPENWNTVACMCLCTLNKSTSGTDLEMPFYEEQKKNPQGV